MAEGQPNESTVLAAMAEVKDPETGRSVTQLGQVSNVQVTPTRIAVTLALTTHYRRSGRRLRSKQSRF